MGLSAKRNDPLLVGVAFGTDGEVATLAHLHHCLALVVAFFGARRCDLDKRNAGLKKEAFERRRDIFARRLGERFQQVFVGGAAERMVGHVFANAVAELLFAEVALEHAQHAATFGVRDRIERVSDVVVGLDRVSNLARADEAIGAHGALCPTQRRDVAA